MGGWFAMLRRAVLGTPAGRGIAPRPGQSLPSEQIPSESLPAEAAFAPFRCPPNAFFRADWLWTSHAGLWSDTRSFIDGPDAAGFNNLPSPTGDNGYRLQGGVRLGNWIFEGVYSHFGDWTSSLNENVNGVAFNAGASAGNWAGRKLHQRQHLFHADRQRRQPHLAGEHGRRPIGPGPQRRVSHRCPAGPHGLFAYRVLHDRGQRQRGRLRAFSRCWAVACDWEWATSTPTSTTTPGPA